MSLTIISVDTGNKNIKTPNTQPFNSGLICHGTSAPPLSVETLKFAGKYYSLTEKRITTMFDKTETEDFYILTLFAAAKEIAAQDGPKPAYKKDICLAMGLPPTHLQELKPKYLKYFGRGGQRVDFVYNGTYYDIRVAQVEVFPQGYAAVVPVSYTHLAQYVVCFTRFQYNILWLIFKRFHRGEKDVYKRQAYCFPPFQSMRNSRRLLRKISNN